MKNFSREDLSFSLCGLNCALCVMKLDGYCPGCGGGAGNQSCAIARCSLAKGVRDYCFECAEYPCEKFDSAAQYDSFILHRNQMTDMQRAKQMGAAAYRAELDEKTATLRYLLENCNDGRRKTFFCLAVNLLELRELQGIISKIKADIPSDAAPGDRAAAAVKCFEEAARQRGVSLRLNKKPKDSPKK